MNAMASQITSLTSVYSTVYSDTDQRKLQSSASLAFVRGIHRGRLNSPHKWPVTRKMFPFDDVIMRKYASGLFLCYFHTNIASDINTARIPCIWYACTIVFMQNHATGISYAVVSCPNMETHPQYISYELWHFMYMLYVIRHVALVLLYMAVKPTFNCD